MRQFGHKRPVRDGDGKIIGKADSPVCAVTRDELGGQFGRDRHHRLILTCAAGDVIEMRPTKTARTVTGTATDVYRFLLTNAARAALTRQKEYSKTMTRKAARRKARKEFGLD
jgi:hypothetical protein